MDPFRISSVLVTVSATLLFSPCLTLKANQTGSTIPVTQ